MSNIQKDLIKLIKKLQPNANKKDKKATYKELLLFVNNNNMGEDELRILYAGDEEKKILGICDLAGKKNSGGKFKDSAVKILNIIHDLMYLSKKQQLFREEFIIYEENIKNMNLGDHYTISKSKEPVHAKVALAIIKVVVEKRPGLQLSEYIKKNCIEEVLKGLEEYEVERKREETRRNEKSYYIDKLVSETAGSISLEPKTWEDVLKLKNKKLLTTEFLSLNYNTKDDDKPQFIDENKELEEELINNFVDPLIKGTQKLNLLNFSESDRKKMHLQYETFDPVFFLEKLYADITLKEFAMCLYNLEENLNSAPTDDGNLIDKNIYKYLDCKKLLDFLVDKFKNQTYSSLNNLKENLISLQSHINTTLHPLKTSFDLILKSKSAKEIIVKFSRFFQMKDKIEHYLKFSNFEELADYLKKINVEIKEISQNRLIYGEFYEFFSKTIEHFKGVLMNIIKESSVPDLVIKHFRYLLEFDVEAETVDELLNGLKGKMCEKIKNDLEYTENFEIRNIKDFFCDEFNVENINEETFAETLKQSDKFIGRMVNEKFINDEGELILNDINGLGNGIGNLINIKDKNKTYKSDKEEKKLLNVESIIKTLYNEIKDFLFMMKVLEENINLKIIHLSSQKCTKFLTIATEVYFTLFEKLKQFLFLSNFNMEEILKSNYNEKKVTDVFSIESSITLNSNQYKFDTDEVMNLFKIYAHKDSTANTLFNENFNKNALQNLSNLLTDLFDLFEVYLDKDTLEALNESKTVTIEKIFMAFLNEKIISNLSFFNEESTINFFDTQLSIFNFSAFSFTKTFIKNICKSYKNIIEFYRNILTKTKDVSLNHEIIYYSLFFLLKSFLLKFYDFYQTEVNGPEDYKRFNCLIVEIMKNYNYLKLEIKTILKTIFKNKVKEYAIYLVDLENFMNCLKNVFIHQYVSNASKVLFNLFVPPINKAIGMPIQLSNYTYNFYEKYNELLLFNQTTFSKSNSRSIPFFTDIRSVFIDMILHLAESIKVFYQLEKENSDTDMTYAAPTDKLTKMKYGNLTTSHTIQNVYGSSLNERLILIISDIIFDFFDNLYIYLSHSSETALAPDPANFKLISQLYIEIELLDSILINFISSKENIEDKIRKVKMIIFDKLLTIKSKKEVNSADESVVFTPEEIERKKKVIEEYSHKYSSYFKCFKIKV